MKTSSTRSLTALALAALLFVPTFLSMTSAEEATVQEDIGEHVGTLTVPVGLDLQQVKLVIGQRLAARRWQIRSATDDTYVAHYERGRNAATLTIKYDLNEVSFYCVGQARGGGLPVRWLDAIKLEINNALLTTLPRS